MAWSLSFAVHISVAFVQKLRANSDVDRAHRTLIVRDMLNEEDGLWIEVLELIAKDWETVKRIAVLIFDSSEPPITLAQILAVLPPKSDMETTRPAP